MTIEHVLLSREGAVAVMTFNRPEALNALTGEMLLRSAQVAQEVADDPQIRCLVVTGAGRAFSAGGDVKGMARRQQQPDDAVSPATATAPSAIRSTEVSRLLYEMPKPTIAAVRGPAAGGGMSIALSADIRIAAESARFVPAFARVGVSGDYGGTWLLQRLVGPARAKELYFTSRTINAQEALALGIVSHVVPDDALMDEAMALAHQFAAGPTVALGLMKDNFRFGATHSFAETLEHEAQNFRISARTDDHHEAAMAFVEKREPRFVGK